MQALDSGEKPCGFLRTFYVYLWHVFCFGIYFAIHIMIDADDATIDSVSGGLQ